MTCPPRAPGGFLLRIYAYPAMVLGLGALAAICLLWLPFALLLRPLLPRGLGQALGRRAVMAGFRLYTGFLQLACGCRFDLSALDALRREPSLILVANHPSLLDAVLIASRLPNVVCVMKAALMDNLLFGAAARLARYIRNDAPLAMILDAREELCRGAHLLIFPEGTRTVDFPLNACTSSAGLIAERSRTAVQTLLIECSTPYLGKAWPLFRRPELPLHFTIRLGRRFEPPRDVAAFTRDLEHHFRQELAQSASFS